MTKERRKLPKYVVEYEVPKGSGKWFVYFRRKGQKDVRMKGVPYSAEWMETYHSLLAGEVIEKPSAPAQRPEERTFAWICLRYMESSEFKELDPNTQHVRRQILQSCIDEPVNKDRPGGDKCGDVPLPRFNAKAVALLRDRKRDTPEAANSRIKAIRQVFKWGCLPEVGVVLNNPARDIAYFKGNNPDGIHTWTQDEVEQYEEHYPLGTRARLALDLALYTFQRRSDIHRIGKQNEKDGSLVFTQFKGRKKTPVHMEIPILPPLRVSLDACAAAGTLGELTYLVNEYGRPYSVAGLGNKVRKWCNDAGLPDCSLHGLRKAACVRMAENGATPHEIMAWSGHKTLKEVERYTREAARRKMAKTAAAKAGRVAI